MSDLRELRQENDLLRKLADSLEKENQSKTEENRAMAAEMDRLTAENEKIYAELHSKKDHKSHTINAESVNIKYLTQQAAELNLQLQRLTNQKSQLEKLLLESNNQLKREKQSSQSPSHVEQQLNERILVLIKQNEGLDRRFQQVQKTLTQLRRDVEEKNRQLRVKGDENNQLRREIQRKEIQISQAHNEITSLKESVRRNEQSQKHSENGQLRDLRYANIDLQNKITSLQRQNSAQLRKIRDLEVDLVHKTAIAAKHGESNQQIETYRQVIANKDQEISSSNTVVRALKGNITLLETKIKQMEARLEDSRRATKAELSRYESDHTSELNELIAKYQQRLQSLEQELRRHKYEKEQLESEQMNNNNDLMRENQQLNQIIRELQEQNHRMYQVAEESRQAVQQSKHYMDKSRPKDDLRDIVEELREQLKEVKYDFKKISSENSRLNEFINKEFYSVRKSDLSAQGSELDDSVVGKYSENFMASKKYPTIHKLRQEVRQEPRPEVFPSRNVEKPELLHREVVPRFRAPTTPTTGNNSLQKEKWGALQKRINQLRLQNEELKNSLNS